MTPKKAIIIIAALFLVITIIFSALYLSQKFFINKTKLPNNNVGELSSAQQKIKEIENKTNQQVEQIIEQNQTPSGGVTPEGQRQIEEAINQEINEKIELKTPEEIAADQKAKEELQKLQDEINAQIKKELESKK